MSYEQNDHDISQIIRGYDEPPDELYAREDRCECGAWPEDDCRRFPAGSEFECERDARRGAE